VTRFHRGRSYGFSPPFVNFIYKIMIHVNKSRLIISSRCSITPQNYSALIQTTRVRPTKCYGFFRRKILTISHNIIIVYDMRVTFVHACMRQWIRETVAIYYIPIMTIIKYFENFVLCRSYKSIDKEYF